MVSIKKVQSGDRVTFAYRGKRDDGVVFETSSISGPLTVTLGEGDLLADLEKALLGMCEGEEKTVQIPMERAYGPKKKELILEIPKEKLPRDLHPRVGMKFLVRQKKSGMPTQIEILSIEKNTITIDANHPLAGHSLNFDLKVLKIVKK